MSFPGFARRLFQNEGAGPLLRKEIIPETITKDDILNISQESTQSGIDKYFPQGCRMFFQQKAAPSGWTKVTTYNDCAIRLVNGDLSNRTNGYSFSGCFASGRGTSAVTISMGTYGATLSSGQMGSHSHGAWHKWASGHDASYDFDEGGGHYTSNTDHGTDALNTGRDDGRDSKYNRGSWQDNVIGWSGNNSGSHSHGTWNNAHSHVTDMNVNYVDTILCERA